MGGVEGGEGARGSGGGGSLEGVSIDARTTRDGQYRRAGSRPGEIICYMVTGHRRPSANWDSFLTGSLTTAGPRVGALHHADGRHGSGNIAQQRGSI